VDVHAPQADVVLADFVVDVVMEFGHWLSGKAIA
jgi:hypothetical protein